MSKTQILIVEDEPDIRRMFCRWVGQIGHTTLEASTGPEAVEVARKTRPALAVIDLHLPGMDGRRVCQELRRFPETRDIPVLTVTGHYKEEGTEVDCLKKGADFFLRKPFSRDKFVLNVRGILRLAQSKPPSGKKDVLRLERLRIDLAAREVYLDKKQISLTRKEFDILHFLAEHRRVVVKTGDIAGQVWHDRAAHLKNTIYVHMQSLRRKLGPYGKQAIQTVPRIGYRFTPTPLKK